MKRCGSENPEDAARRCFLPVGPHYDHGDERGYWPNREVQLASARRTASVDAGLQKARAIVAGAQPASSTRLTPVGRPEPREPRPGTLHAEVLERLRTAAGPLTTADLGGPPALAALYDLRDELRWPIRSEMRPAGFWVHRL